MIRWLVKEEELGVAAENAGEPDAVPLAHR